MRFKNEMKTSEDSRLTVYTSFHLIGETTGFRVAYHDSVPFARASSSFVRVLSNIIA